MGKLTALVVFHTVRSVLAIAKRVAPRATQRRLGWALFGFGLAFPMVFVLGCSGAADPGLEMAPLGMTAPTSTTEPTPAPDAGGDAGTDAAPPPFGGYTGTPVADCVAFTSTWCDPQTSIAVVCPDSNTTGTGSRTCSKRLAASGEVVHPADGFTAWCCP